MRSTLRLSMVLAGVGLLLAACSSGAAFSHVHNISYDGSALVLGTHEGVWTQAAPSEQPVQTSREAFDVMGFAQAGERWLASGHPAHGGDGPADIGVVESTDKGVT